MYFIQLPINKFEITNSDCVEKISNSFPFIKLNKLSSIYDSSIFTTLNSFKVNIEGNLYDCRIDADESIYDSNINDYVNFIKLLIINNDVNSITADSLTIEVFNNNYLPVLFTPVAVTFAIISLLFIRRSTKSQ